MKIYNTPSILKAYNQKKTPAPAQTSRVADKNDQMQVSQEAQLMNKILQTVKNAPEIREEKVNRLKDVIKDGTYNVSTADVAEKMLNGILFDKKG